MSINLLLCTFTHDASYFVIYQINMLFNRDTDNDLSNTNKLLEDLQLSAYSSDGDRSVIRYLCSVLSMRTAQLVSAFKYSHSCV